MFSRIYMICFFVLLLVVTPIYAEKMSLKHFVSGSYQQLLEENADKPFMLAIWSTTCSSCMEKWPC